MTDIGLDKLEALADGATGDAWEIHQWQPEGEILICGGEGQGYGLIATVNDDLPNEAAFIAAANPATIKSLIASAREAAAEIERLRARFTELADDFERRADACHDLNKSRLEQRDRMRLHGKEAAYRHAMMLARAAQMDGEG